METPRGSEKNLYLVALKSIWKLLEQRVSEGIPGESLTKMSLFVPELEAGPVELLLSCCDTERG